MHSDMQVQNDLAALFSRNLNFNPDFRPSAPQEQPRQEPDPVAPSAQPIVYSISQHYTHSYHVAKPSQQPEASSTQANVQRPSSEPPQSDVLSPETILRNHGVDPSVLMPAQIELFRTADQPQQLRLMELWSICPPSRSEAIPALAWCNTTIEQEEHLTRIRYERLQQNQDMSLDGTVVQVSNNGGFQQSPPEIEPYMTSGYAELMRREQERQESETRQKEAYSQSGNFVGGPSYTPATDPVYMGSSYVRRDRQHMDMATQYGAFEAFRSGEAMDGMDVIM